jgi:glycosyltransferase involved in cell wall biosynthesis
MKVAVDARALSGPRTGLAVYTTAILVALQRLDPTLQLCLYSTDDIECNELEAEQVTLRFPPSTMLRSTWEKVRLLPRLRSQQPDLWFSPISAVPPGLPCPSVAVVHDLAMFRHPEIMPTRYLGNWIKSIRGAAARANLVIAVSHSTKNDLVMLADGQKDKIRVVHEAAEAVYFQPIDKTVMQKTLDHMTEYDDFNLQPGYMLYPATLEPRKNHITLLHSYGELDPEIQKAMPLVLVGNIGWGDMREVVENLETAPNVHWVMSASRPQLQALYAGARLCTFPSIYEGFGLPVLEAMAAGVPVLCSDTSSLPEVAGSAAHMLPPRNVDAWKEAIQELVDDDKELQRMSDAGRAQAGRFSWEKAAQETLAVFHEALA